MQGFVRWLVVASVVAGGCGEEQAPQRVTNDDPFAMAPDVQSIRAANGDVDVYLGHDIRSALVPDQEVDFDWRKPYAVIHLPAATARLALERKGTADPVVTLSFCNAANGFTLTEHYVGAQAEDRGAFWKTFAPGDTDVLGRIHVAASSAVEGELVAAYALQIVERHSGGYSVLSSGAGDLTDSTPEDPLTGSCNRVP